MAISRCKMLNEPVYLAYLEPCVGWPRDQGGLGLTLWPRSSPGAVGRMVGEGGPGGWGPGVVTRDGWVVASVRDGSQKYSCILPYEARVSTCLLHWWGMRLRLTWRIEGGGLPGGWKVWVLPGGWKVGVLPVGWKVEAYLEGGRWGSYLEDGRWRLTWRVECGGPTWRMEGEGPT